MEKIKVIAKLPNTMPYVTWVSNSLQDLQKFVGGHIEVVPLTTDTVVICNEDGRLKGLEHNCEICGIDFVGDIIICGVDGEEFTDILVDIGIFKLVFPKLWEVK